MCNSFRVILRFDYNDDSLYFFPLLNFVKHYKNNTYNVNISFCIICMLSIFTIKIMLGFIFQPLIKFHKYIFYEFLFIIYYK